MTFKKEVNNHTRIERRPNNPLSLGCLPQLCGSFVVVTLQYILLLRINWIAALKTSWQIWDEEVRNINIIAWGLIQSRSNTSSKPFAYKLRSYFIRTASPKKVFFRYFSESHSEKSRKLLLLQLKKKTIRDYFFPKQRKQKSAVSNNCTTWNPN